MIWILYDIETGTVLSHGLTEPTGYSNDKSSAQVSHVFWDAQPTFLYRYNGAEIEVNTEENIKQYISSDTVGHIDYNDSTGIINIEADTWTDIPNNGQGPWSNSLNKPYYVNELMNTNTGYINVNDLFIGDSILIRNDYKVNPNTNNAKLEFRYSLGSGLGEYTQEKIMGRLDSGSGIDYRFNLGTDLIYIGDSNTKENPIKLQIKLSSNGTLINAGSVIKVLK